MILTIETLIEETLGGEIRYIDESGKSFALVEEEGCYCLYADRTRYLIHGMEISEDNCYVTFKLEPITFITSGLSEFKRRVEMMPHILVSEQLGYYEIIMNGEIKFMLKATMSVSSDSYVSLFLLPPDASGFLDKKEMTVEDALTYVGKLAC